MEEYTFQCQNWWCLFSEQVISWRSSLQKQNEEENGIYEWYKKYKRPPTGRVNIMESSY
jgi:hypothetical protein